MAFDTIPGLPGATLPTLLALLSDGIVYFAPVRDAANQVIDFHFGYLNAAAQDLLGLPAHPTTSYLQQWPDSADNGAFAALRDALRADTPVQLPQQYRTPDHARQLQVQVSPLDGGLLARFTAAKEYGRAHPDQLLPEVQHLRQELQASNAALETQVQARTHEVQQARTIAERQRGELSRVFEQAPVAIAVYRGPSYLIELANPTVCRLWGRTPEQILGKGLFEALPEVAGMGYEELLDGVMATGTPYVAYAMEAQHDRNGSRETVYWDFVYEPMYENDGRIYGVMVVATEVTAQVLARQQMQQLNEELEMRVQARTAETQAALREAQEQREQLEEQQAFLRQILSQVPAAVATLNGPEHRFAFFNDRYADLTGGRAMLHQTVAQQLPEVVEQGFIGLLDHVYHSGEPFIGKGIAIVLEQPTGPPVQQYLDFTYQTLTDRLGQRQGILVFAIDVSEQVRARQAREAQQQLVETVFEQSPTAIWVVEGPDYVFRIVNPMMEQILGHTRAQVLGRPYFEVMPELISQGVPELLSQVWHGGETIEVSELPSQLAYHQPDKPGYFSFVFQPLRNAQGKVARIACVALDVTDQVMARQQVQTLNEELAAINGELQITNKQLGDTNHRLTRTNTDLDTFVYTASHDLKAPIANIEGLLLALRQQLPAEALQGPLVPRLFDMMESSVARFQQTIGHLTDISQLQQTEAPETLDLTTLINDVRLDLAPLFETAPVTLTVTVDDCQTVRVAAKTLRSVVYNLLSNAVKYRAPERPTIVQLRAHCLAGRLVLSVQDNGLGLDTSQQAALFGMFRRLHTHVEGSGVGLFMVKRLIENTGGTITVDSQPGVGSTFTVSLPA